VLCGAHRPGHFSGVATVVARLFNMVQPDVAVFGRKDLQQLQVIRHLVADLAFPVEIHGVATAREADGLALSSRNQYLSASERATAPQLHAALRRLLGEALGGRDPAEAEADGRRALELAGFEVDYLVLRRESRLDEPVVAPAQHDDLVALGAARLGRTRLIDNLARSEWEPAG
jgi:pantoate--beta-alanine ligase